MKHTAIHIILFLAIPALCQASIGPDKQYDPFELIPSGPAVYRLEVENGWRTDLSAMDHIEVIPDVLRASVSAFSLDGINGGIPFSSKEPPGDMVSMMSFVWAELFGGVDIVAEVKEFAREARRRGRFLPARRDREPDSRKQWKLVVAYRIDDQTEVAALYKYRGSLFSDGDIALLVSALDPLSEEVGLKMAYSGGEFDIRADRMTLTDRAEAKIKVTF